MEAFIQGISRMVWGYVVAAEEATTVEHREFERHPLDLLVEVFDDHKGKSIEHTHLKNISGGGACFLSSSPEAYEPGQEVILEMRLPVTDGQEALMQGRATIVWIGEANPEGKEDPGVKQVGVSMIHLVSVGVQGGGPVV